MSYPRFWLWTCKVLGSIIRICFWLLFCRKLNQANTEGVKGVYKGMPGSLEGKEKNGE